MEKRLTIRVKELAKKLGLSYSTLSLHLCHFDKYKLGNLNHFLFYYNENFLTDLRDFYCEKVNNYDGKLYDKYIQVIERIDKMLLLLQKGNQFKKYMATVKNR